MPTVRVTCPECEFSFSIADSRVGGLIACRDCKAEFRVEFAEEEDEPPAAAAPPVATDDRPSRRAARTRMDADHEPETWKTDLPIRSPMPLLFILVGLQVVAAGFLVFNGFMPAGGGTSSPTYSYYGNYPTAPKVATPATRR